MCSYAAEMILPANLIQILLINKISWIISQRKIGKNSGLSSYPGKIAYKYLQFSLTAT